MRTVRDFFRGSFAPRVSDEASRERGRMPEFGRATPAALADFADGDVVTNVDGVAVTELSPQGVLVLMMNRAPGTKVKVVAMRGDKSVSVGGKLGPSQ